MPRCKWLKIAEIEMLATIKKSLNKRQNKTLNFVHFKIKQMNVLKRMFLYLTNMIEF